MIIISLRFDGGSTEEEHDIAHIASSIVARVCGLFFIFFSLLCAADPESAGQEQLAGRGRKGWQKAWARLTRLPDLVCRR